VPETLITDHDLIIFNFVYGNQSMALVGNGNYLLHNMLLDLLTGSQDTTWHPMVNFQRLKSSFHNVLIWQKLQQFSISSEVLALHECIQVLISLLLKHSFWVLIVDAGKVLMFNRPLLQ
jgi:hypothetical protein